MVPKSPFGIGRSSCWFVRWFNSWQQSSTVLFATVLAILFKVNLPVALFVTLYSNPLTIVPIYLVAYAIGAFVTNDVANNMSWAELHLLDKNMNEWVPLIFDWLFSFGKPLLIGIFLLALLLSVMGYFMVQGAWRLYIMYEWEKKKETPSSLISGHMAPVYWEQAIQELADNDGVMRNLILRFKGTFIYSHSDAFTTLARSIVGQQISVKAAESIWQKVVTAVVEITLIDFMTHREAHYIIVVFLYGKQTIFKIYRCIFLIRS